MTPNCKIKNKNYQSDPFVELEEIPICFKYVPSLSIHPKESKSVILSTEFNAAKPGIYKFNLDTNKIDILSKYNDDNFDAEEHAQFINPCTNKLYIFGGYNQSFAAYNLTTKEIEYSNKDKAYDLCGCSSFPRTAYIPQSKQLHVWDQCTHLIFSINRDEINQLEANTYDETMYGPKLLYIPTQQKLMGFGWNCHDIWSYDMTENDPEWITEDIKLPYVGTNDYQVCLGFDDILFIFYHNCCSDSMDPSVWIYDLKYDKLYETKYRPPIQRQPWGLRVIKTGDYAHFLSFRFKYHYKVCFYDLMPNELLKTRINEYDPLVMGYCREKEEKKQIPNTPYVLKQLILTYFPFFCTKCNK